MPMTLSDALQRARPQRTDVIALTRFFCTEFHVCREVQLPVGFLCLSYEVDGFILTVKSRITGIRTKIVEESSVFRFLNAISSFLVRCMLLAHMPEVLHLVVLTVLIRPL